MTRKSQVSIEFMFMVMAATFMIIPFMFIFSELYQDKMSEKKANIMEDFAYSIQTELVVASEARDGYIREVLVPVKLEGFEYEVYLSGQQMILNYTENAVVLPVPEASGNLQKGTNIITKETGSICVNC